MTDFALDTLITEVGKRRHYLDILIYPPDELLDGVIVSIEAVSDKLGMTTEIAKITASSINEAAARLLADKTWQAVSKGKKK